MITKNNYEIYFLDYYDGSLPAEQVAELFLFLEHHPDLKGEFEAFENIKLTDDLTDEFPAKATLKKMEVDHTNVQEFLIKEFEGDLNTSEQKELNDFVAAHPALLKDRTLYTKTKVVADLSIKYPNKGELKKTISMFGNRNLIFTVSIAASLLLLLGIYFISNQEISPSQNNAVAIVDDNANGNGVDSAIQDKSPVTNTDKPNEVVKTLDQKLYTKEKISAPQIKENSLEKEKNQFANNSKQPHLNRIKEQQVQQNKNEPEQNVAQQKEQPGTNQQQNNVEQNPVAQNNTDATNQSVAVLPKTTIINTEGAVASTTQQSVKETMNSFANEKLAQLTGSDNFTETGKRKSKKMDMLTWAVNKVGGKKVKMVTQYDSEDKVAAVDVATKGFSIEHVKGF